MSLEDMSFKQETPCESTNDLNVLTGSIDESSHNESNKLVDELKEECLALEECLFDNTDNDRLDMLELRTGSGCEVAGDMEKELLYLDHEVKDELVVGPEVLQEPVTRSMVEGHLYEHSMLHTDIMEHKCTECGKLFRRRGNLLRHNLLHARQKIFTCECGKEFQTQANLVTHANRHSPKSFSCEICSKTFQKYYQLRKHETSHELFCRLCGELFKMRSDLIEHKAVHMKEWRHCR